MPDRNSTFKKNPSARSRFPRIARAVITLRQGWRALRVLKFARILFGYQFAPAQDQIEIDLTYLCNLQCNNCNRSSAQAPEAMHLELEQLRRFVSDSLAQGRNWSRIRLLGGEPTLHPEFDKVFGILEPLRAVSPRLVIEVVSNGYGDKVRRKLEALPTHVWVENSAKQGNVQPHFGPFNLAPQDAWWHRWVDYRHGCSIPKQCGMGLTPTGYYPCAVAGGIDRVTGAGHGRAGLPAPGDNMRDLMDRACRLCGRFRDGYFVPFTLRPALNEQLTSPSWQRIYEEWSAKTSERKATGA
jgi:sulfatase maturation enzyme AslB (radical SAM superfamily)